jgi:hypothetical protein
MQDIQKQRTAIYQNSSYTIKYKKQRAHILKEKYMIFPSELEVHESGIEKKSVK